VEDALVVLLSFEFIFSDFHKLPLMLLSLIHPLILFVLFHFKSLHEAVNPTQVADRILPQKNANLKYSFSHDAMNYKLKEEVKQQSHPFHSEILFQERLR
jgi:hypothetical protein